MWTRTAGTVTLVALWLFGADSAPAPTTSRSCLLRPDESEICFYRNICWDGSAFVALQDAATTDELNSRSGTCTGEMIDWRHFEISWPPRGYEGPWDRQYGVGAANPPGYSFDASTKAKCLVPHAMARAREARALDAAEVFGRNPASAFPKGVGDYSVEWSDKSTYFAAIDNHWQVHPLHFGVAVLSLWDILQMNHTGAEFQAKGMRYFASAGRKLPPMDAVGIIGAFDKLGSWTDGLLKLITQPNTEQILGEELTSGYSPEHMLCLKHAAIVGQKPQGFTGAVDASALRMKAWQYAGITESPQAHRPPQRVIMVNRRTSRWITNVAQIRDLMEAIGVEFEYHDEFPRSFKEQVALMSTAGVLIVPHGAGVMNGIFLPAHSVLIEAFPYMMQTRMFSNIVHHSKVHHLTLLTNEKPPEDFGPLYHGEEFVEGCEGKHNRRLRSFTVGECVRNSKSSNIVVNIEQLLPVLAEALDVIDFAPFYETLKTDLSGITTDQRKQK